MTQPVRVGADLFESARRTGAALDRSAAQQLSHWARIGREIEASSALSVADHRKIADAATYDDLTPADQALVRAQWELAMDDTVAGLDLRARFAAEGKSFAVVADAKGETHDVAVGRPRRATKKATGAKKTAPKKARARAKA